MKMIMKKAWEIARYGQKKHGGKVSEYFSESLKLAWKMFKKEKAEQEIGIMAKRQGDYIVLAIRSDKDNSFQAFNGSRPAKEWEIKSMGIRKDAEGREWAFTRIESHLTVKALGHTIRTNQKKEIIWK